MSSLPSVSLYSKQFLGALIFPAHVDKRDLSTIVSCSKDLNHLLSDKQTQKVWLVAGQKWNVTVMEHMFCYCLADSFLKLWGSLIHFQHINIYKTLKFLESDPVLGITINYIDIAKLCTYEGQIEATVSNWDWDITSQKSLVVHGRISKARISAWYCKNNNLKVSIYALLRS